MRPTSVLTGPLADQGALHGVLDLLFMLNLPLIRVERCQDSLAGSADLVRLVDWEMGLAGIAANPSLPLPTD